MSLLETTSLNSWQVAADHEPLDSFQVVAHELDFETDGLEDELESFLSALGRGDRMPQLNMEGELRVGAVSTRVNRWRDSLEDQAPAPRVNRWRDDG
jgi:hypothetical protein